MAGIGFELKNFLKNIACFMILEHISYLPW